MPNYCPRVMLVTGGAGFIGSNFIHHVISSPAPTKIINLDKLTYAGNLTNLNNLPDAEKHIFMHGDICNRALLDKLFKTHQIDTIVHFAAESHVDRSITSPASFVETNIFGTYQLLETAWHSWSKNKLLQTEHCRFVHISTDEVYGSLTPDDSASSEKSPYCPNSPYSASKAGSDHLVRAYHQTYGLPVLIDHCTNNYGPNQHAEKFIPTIISSCMQGTNIPIYGDGKQIRDWLYVEDHCAGIWRMLTHGKIGEVYNFSANNQYSNLAITKMICKYFDNLYPDNNLHSRLISYVKDRLGHDRRYALEHSKSHIELNWAPKHSLKSGLERTIRSVINMTEPVS